VTCNSPPMCHKAAGATCSGAAICSYPNDDGAQCPGGTCTGGDCVPMSGTGGATTNNGGTGGSG
jgi:hypothetical protein